MSRLDRNRVQRALSSGTHTHVGVPAFVKAFSSETSRGAYQEWLKHPVTKLFRGVIQDLLVNGPYNVEGPTDIAVEHGMTTAYGTVFQLLENPEFIIPEVFSCPEGTTLPSGVPDDSYSQTTI